MACRSDDPENHASRPAAAAPAADSSPQAAAANPSERAAGPDSSLGDAEVVNADMAMPAADDADGQASVQRDLEASDAAQLIAEGKATSAEPMQT